MTERFNFYDIYGYVIPGLAFVSLAWIPFGLAFHDWPKLELSSAFIVLIGAYACGFLINRLTAKFVRISVYDEASGEYRQPSDLMLDPECKLDLKLSEDVRVGVIAGILDEFGLDVSSNRKLRPDASLLCRRVLQADAPSYAEQFQGLYTFCETLAAVLLLIAFYYVGWAASPWISSSYALVGLAVCIAIVSTFSRNSLVFVLLPFISLGAGITCAGESGVGTNLSRVLPAMAIVACALAIQFYNLFRYFSNVLTVTVYRDFYVIAKSRSRQTGGLNGREIVHQGN